MSGDDESWRQELEFLRKKNTDLNAELYKCNHDLNKCKQIRDAEDRLFNSAIRESNKRIKKIEEESRRLQKFEIINQQQARTIDFLRETLGECEKKNFNFNFLINELRTHIFQLTHPKIGPESDDDMPRQGGGKRRFRRRRKTRRKSLFKKKRTKRRKRT